MIFFNVLCFISTIEFLYFMYETMQWNFHHGYALRNMKDIVEIIRLSILMTFIFVSSNITKLICGSMLFLFLYYFLM